MRALHPDGRRPKFKTDTLKAIVVAKNTTVCFAGNIDAGLYGVRAFARGVQESTPLEARLDVLQQLASDNRRPVDFIVAMGGGASQLTRIRSTGLESDLQTAWIGDQMAFEYFQVERNKPFDESRRTIESVFTASQRVMSALQRAMDAVIAHPTIESVDGFCVRIAYKPGGFEYLSSMFIHLGRDIVVHHGDELINKMAQSVEEGGYSVSVVEPAEPGTPALGLNFPRARIGILFLPLQFEGGQVIEDVAPRDFAKVAFERFGVRMKDPPLR
jgi:hypothetical protein